MPMNEGKSLIAQRFRGFLPVVIDVETGGFNSRTDGILEIAATLLRMDDAGNLEPDETLSYNVEPFEGANLETAALEFTGINPYNPNREAHKEVTAMGELMKKIRQQVKAHGCTRAVLVGHNAHFDLGFVLAAIERSGIKRNPFHPFSVMDTASWPILPLTTARHTAPRTMPRKPQSCSARSSTAGRIWAAGAGTELHSRQHSKNTER